jgi:uncharacterized membrane protein YvbJ
MIKCPECKKDVSESAVACPSCGFPVAKTLAAPKKEMESIEKKQMAGGCLGLVGVGMLIAALAGVVKYFTGAGPRPPEDNLQDFKVCGAFGTILLIVAYKLVVGKKRG